MTRSLHPLLLLAALCLPSAGGAQQAEPAAGAAPGVAEANARPGDRVWLRIWNEPEMSDTFNISETGEVVLPKLGSVHVADLGASLLQDSLRRAYSVYLRNPSVEVVVLRRIGVQGEVWRPGIYLADLTMGLPDLIAMAGGFTNTANPDNVVVIRGEERIRYRRSDQAEFLVTGLQSGDQVYVRRKSALQRDPVGTLTAVMTLVSGFTVWVLPAIKNIFSDDDKAQP